MADDDGKTEEPTGKRLSQAREDGDIIMSQGTFVQYPSGVQSQ